MYTGNTDQKKNEERGVYLGKVSLVDDYSIFSKDVSEYMKKMRKRGRRYENAEECFQEPKNKTPDFCAAPYDFDATKNALVAKKENHIIFGKTGAGKGFSAIKDMKNRETNEKLL